MTILPFFVDEIGEPYGYNYPVYDTFTNSQQPLLTGTNAILSNFPQNGGGIVQVYRNGKHLWLSQNLG